MDFMRLYLSNHVWKSTWLVYCIVRFYSDWLERYFNNLYTGIILDDTYEPRSY